MSSHSKDEVVINPKTLIYIALAVAIILIAVFIIVSVCKDDTSGGNTINSTNTSQSSSNVQSEQTDSDATQSNSPNPQIKGVENGKIYYTTQHIIITDDNLKNVTVNGDNFNDNFFIEGNAENMYVIEATDYDNNITTYVVYTKTIKSLTDTINTYSKHTVTANDLESIKSIQESIQNTGTQYSPTEETSALDAAYSTCENLVNIITTIQTKIDKITKEFENPESIEAVQNNTHMLAACINDIDELLATNNLTAEQRSKLVTIRAKYSSWMSKATANQFNSEPQQ